MTLGSFVVRNATRNRRRFILTLLSVTFSLFLLAVLLVMLRGLTDPATTDEAALRIVVRHKVSLANMLFSKYKERIQRMPGVKYCTKLLWFGGIYRDEKNFFPQFACDPDTIFNVLSDARIDPGQLAAFIRGRTACVVGIKTMQRFGWKIGDRITLIGAMWPCNLELTIRGVYTGTVDETNLFFHHEYFDEALGDKGFTGLFWVRCENAAAVPRLIEQIDGEFANSDAETKTETQQAFQLGFVSMLGNLKLLIGSICTVIVFTLVLVTGGTMSMAIRERGREIAILKAVGYESPLLFGLLLGESFGLAILGGVIGCAGAWLLLQTVDIYRLSRGLFVNFEVTGQIIAQTLGIAVMLGLASCLWPAWRSIRRSVMSGLRTAE
ncbi:MAG TPA: FtsX-like permease family protein [Verrucomicrobiae bacterium]|nr:FtsX-like permease family protein [Verrucomicrobiae bacterium]